MSDKEKPVDVFSLFGGKAKQPETAKEIKPIQSPTSEQELAEWLSVDNDALFTEVF